MGSDRPFLIYCNQALGHGGSAAAGRPGKVENATPRAQRPSVLGHTGYPSFRPGQTRGEGRGRLASSPPRAMQGGAWTMGGGNPRGGLSQEADPPPCSRGLGRRLRAGFQATAWRSPGIGPRALCGAAAGDRSARPREQPALPRLRPAPSPAPASGQGTPVPTRRAPGPHPARPLPTGIRALACPRSGWPAASRLNCFFMMAVVAREARAGQLGGRPGAATSLPDPGGGGGASQAGAPPSPRHFQQHRTPGQCRAPAVPKRQAGDAVLTRASAA